MKEFHLLIWLTQLGISVAVPPVLCTLGAMWLRSRFSLGPWVIFAGIGIGFYLAIGGFRTSLKAMEQMGRRKGKSEEPPPASFNEHR